MFRIAFDQDIAIQFFFADDRSRIADFYSVLNRRVVIYILNIVLSVRTLYGLPLEVIKFALTGRSSCFACKGSVYRSCDCKPCCIFIRSVNFDPGDIEFRISGTAITSLYRSVNLL